MLPIRKTGDNQWRETYLSGQKNFRRLTKHNVAGSRPIYSWTGDAAIHVKNRVNISSLFFMLHNENSFKKNNMNM